MENKDILKLMKTKSESILPGEGLTPESIEKTLQPVKRTSYKGVAAACISLALCICIGAAALVYSLPIQQLPVNTNTAADKSTPAVTKTSYKEIYETIASIKQYPVYTNNSKDLAMEENLIAGEASDSGSGNTNNYSKTNNQVENAEEGDIVKTDGQYIYSAYNSTLSIVFANSGAPEKVYYALLDFNPSELFLYGNTMVLVENSGNDCISYDTSSYQNESPKTSLHFYDITDKSNPTAVTTLGQDGSYISARVINNVLYTVTSSAVYDLEAIDKGKPETYIPQTYVNDTSGCISSNDIAIGTVANYVNYVNTTSVDLDNFSAFADVKSILGSGSDVYCSLNNLYVTYPIWQQETEQQVTQIFKYSLNGTAIAYQANTTINGTVLNQFSMDEYNGYFRIVTETYTNSGGNDASVSTSSGNTAACLTVLDSNLNPVGSIENVAKGELVKSVRFHGDVGYFVTFRQTDPLFTVDLSSPENPSILHELKIPGFSEYLHPFGDGLLLGFGSDADTNTGGVTGLKLSMFNTTDKTNVTELATIVFSEYTRQVHGAFSEAQYNHKAIFVDAEQKLIGIPFWEYTDTDIKGYYVLFSFDGAAFKEIQRVPLQSEIGTRGLYIGEYFYVVNLQSVSSYALNTWEQTAVLKLPYTDQNIYSPYIME